MAPANARPIVLIVLVAAVLAFAVTYMFMPRGPRTESIPGPMVMGNADRLEPLYDVPDFELTNQDGETVNLDDLAGHVWVADFIFTRCPSICPRLTANMAALHQRLTADSGGGRANVRLVSFSVDPNHDTPEVLKAYAQRHEADLSRWTFLTGERDAMWQLIEKGFRLAVSEDPDNVQMPIAHSGKFALVDQAGRVRRYYDGTTQHEFDDLLKDIDALLQSK